MTNSNSQYAGIASNQVRNVKNTKSSGNQVWDNVERAASASSGHGAGRPSAIREHFPALRPGAGPSNSASVPGSAAHSSANRAAAFRAAHGHTPWSTSSRPSTGPASAPSPAPRPQPVSINTAASRVAAGTSSNRSVPKPTESAFPSLPSNASQAALLAHKRAVLSKNNSSNTGGGGASANGGGSAGSGSGSGSNSPWASGSVGRIDGLGSTTPDGTRSPSNREEDPFPPVSGGKGKKKKGKQVILSFGGVPT